MERAVPLADTPAAAYLRGRGLGFADVADLLAHQDLTHWETKSGYPGMIGVVRDLAGNHLPFIGPICRSMKMPPIG